MFQAPLCTSSGARENYTVGCCLWYLVHQIQNMLHLVGILFPHTNDNAGQNHFKFIRMYVVIDEIISIFR